VERKVYSCKSSKKVIVAEFVIPLALFCLCMWAMANAGGIVEWIYGTALKESVSVFRGSLLFIGAVLLILILFLILLESLHIAEIVFSKDGVLFNRRFRSFTIRKVTDLKIFKIRGRETKITITGLAPDGGEVRKTIARTGGVGKRWEEFKGDLQKIKSK